MINVIIRAQQHPNLPKKFQRSQRFGVSWADFAPASHPPSGPAPPNMLCETKVATEG